MNRAKPSPVVSEVEKVPRRKEYSLKLSDGTELRVLEDHLSRFGLSPGKPLSDSLIKQIAFGYELAKARDAALRLLRVRPRTEMELRRRLRGKGFSADAAATLLDEFKAGGVVDDRVFAQLWIKEKKARGDSGRRLIYKHLAAKGIERGILEEELRNNYDHSEEIDIASRLAHSRVGRMKDLPEVKVRQRLLGYLLRRGFDGDTAGQAIECALAGYGKDELI
jgi:regulatory protein